MVGIEMGQNDGKKMEIGKGPLFLQTAETHFPIMGITDTQRWAPQLLQLVPTEAKELLSSKSCTKHWSLALELVPTVRPTAQLQFLCHEP